MHGRGSAREGGRLTVRVGGRRRAHRTAEDPAPADFAPGPRLRRPRSRLHLRAPAPTAPGCGWLPAAEVVGLLGADVAAREVGSPAVLREQRTRIRCRTTVPGHPERFVAIEAEHHPRPPQLPPTSCSAGWVYAGTADKFAPACQDSADGHGRTQLFVWWQPYVVRVTTGRADRSWAGDPEAALRMSRALAQRLGVRAASGEG